MDRTSRLFSVIGARLGALLLVGVVSVGLTGCYTQLKTAETARSERAETAHAADTAPDGSGYADEYRRNDRRPSQADGTGAKYEYQYQYKYGALIPYVGYDDPFADPFYDSYYGPRPQLGLSVRFGAPLYAYRPWRTPRSSWHSYYGYDGWGGVPPFTNVYYGDIYYDGEGTPADRDDRRTYRSRTSTRSGIGRQPAAAPPRTAARGGERSRTEAAAGTREARTRTSRAGADDETRARSGRVGRSGQVRDAPDRRGDDRSTRRARSPNAERYRTRDRAREVRRDRSRSRTRSRAPRTRSDRSSDGRGDRSRSARSRDDDE
jgi:hypothetical protein